MGQPATASVSSPSNAPSGTPSHRGQRRLRNFLLDRHFQLKYSGYLVGVAVFLSATLGFFLWQTSRELITVSCESFVGDEPRCHRSPTNPTSASSSPWSSTSRSFSTGRRTMSSRVPRSVGDERT